MKEETRERTWVGTPIFGKGSLTLTKVHLYRKNQEGRFKINSKCDRLDS